MRSEYNILWLDDDFIKTTNTLDDIVSSVRSHLINEGFIPNIYKVSAVEEVKVFLGKNKKIDLFLSDYNIDDSFSGLDFLVMTRKKYKQEMLLYSNQSEEEIRKYLINFLKSKDNSLELFGKFTFESANRKSLLIKEILRLIDLTLIRWNELNAIRGLYLSETSQVDNDCKEYIIANLGDTDFVNDIINNFKRNFSGKRETKNNIIDSLSNKNLNNINRFEFHIIQCLLSKDVAIFKQWNEIREIRNGCAHVKRDTDTVGEYIILKDGITKIYERDIASYRVKLQKFLCEFYKLIDNNSEVEEVNDSIIEDAVAI